MKHTFKLTTSITYEADTDDYGTTDVANMIAIDIENLLTGMANIEDFGDPTVDFSITEIK